MGLGVAGQVGEDVTDRPAGKTARLPCNLVVDRTDRTFQAAVRRDTTLDRRLKFVVDVLPAVNDRDSRITGPGWLTLHRAV
jgi:hypothetical protein